MDGEVSKTGRKEEEILDACEKNNFHSHLFAKEFVLFLTFRPLDCPNLLVRLADYNDDFFWEFAVCKIFK